MELPSWIVSGPVSDASFNYVVCSHDGIDPEEARQIAESKCLASATKLNGVNVKFSQKTVQSLTGSDSSEVAEIQPLEKRVKCEWVDRFLEPIKDGYRVWLRCKKSKTFEEHLMESESKTEHSKISIKHFEATLILTTVPAADRIIVTGADGDRVFESKSNIFHVKISSRDRKIEVKKSGYKSASVEIPSHFSHGSVIELRVLLSRD